MLPSMSGSAACVFILPGELLLFEWLKNKKNPGLTCLLVFLSDKSDISELSSFLFVTLRVIALLIFIRNNKKKNPPVRGFEE